MLCRCFCEGDKCNKGARVGGAAALQLLLIPALISLVVQ